MKTTLSILFVTIVAFAQGQVPAIKKVKKVRPPAQWDTLYFKNELSLDVGLPLAFLFSGQPPEAGSVALTYLRAVTKRDFIRIGTRHRFEENNWTEDNLPAFPNQSSTPGVYPSVIVKTNKSFSSYSPDLRIGYEHRFGKRRIKGIVGADISLGAEIENNNYSYQYFQPQTVTDSTGFTQVYIMPIDIDPQLQIRGWRSVNFKVGVAPMAGMFAHLSPRISLRVLAMMDFYWSHSVAFSGDAEFTKPADTFKAGSTAIIGEAALTVHF